MTISCSFFFLSYSFQNLHEKVLSLGLAGGVGAQWLPFCAPSLYLPARGTPASTLSASSSGVSHHCVSVRPKTMKSRLPRK